MAHGRISSGAAVLNRSDAVRLADGPEALARGLAIGLPVSLMLWASLALAIF